MSSSGTGTKSWHSTLENWRLLDHSFSSGKKSFKIELVDTDLLKNAFG